MSIFRKKLSFVLGPVFGLLLLSIFLSSAPQAHADNFVLQNSAAKGLQATLSSTTASNAADASATQALTNAAGGTLNTGCNLVGLATLNPFSYANCIGEGVGIIILGLANFLLGVAGTLFNYVVIKGVFQFSTFIGNSPGLLAAWKILRDIGNMGLLFGFIFIGLATILDLHTYTAKKALPRLIIFAVLMNFSLFAAEAVIDVSNVFSSVMYAQANTDPCSLGGTTQVSGSAAGSTYNEQSALEGTCGVNYGIAGHIMESTGLSTIFSIGPGELPFSVYAGLALFAIIGAAVFIAAALMLAIRVVVLTFLMVLAPLGFAGMALPPFQKMASSWWNNLIKQAFFAPVMLLMLFVSLKIADSFGTVSGGGLAGALSQPNVSTMGIFLVFTLVIGFMLASLVVAKNMGATGASWATQAAGKYAFGSVGWVGRATLGRASAKVAQRVRSSSIGRTDTGRMIAGVFDKGYHASYDLRAAPLAGPQFKKIDFGSAQKGGLHHDVDEAVKARTKYADTLKMSDEEKATDKRLKGEKEDLEDELKELKKNKAPKPQIRAKQDQIEAKNKEIAKNTPSNQYAQSMEDFSHTTIGQTLRWYDPVGHHARHEAADKIKKNATKSKMDRALEDIKNEASKNSGDDDSHGGGGGHTPAPAPAPSGGGGGGGDHGGGHGGH